MNGLIAMLVVVILLAPSVCKFIGEATKDVK